MRVWVVQAGQREQYIWPKWLYSHNSLAKDGSAQRGTNGKTRTRYDEMFQLSVFISYWPKSVAFTAIRFDMITLRPLKKAQR